MKSLNRLVFTVIAFEGVLLLLLVGNHFRLAFSEGGALHWASAGYGSLLLVILAAVAASGLRTVRNNRSRLG